MIFTPQQIGIASLIVQLTANIPYILGIVRGGVRPNRTSFFIFSLLSFIAYFSQAASGATFSNFLTLGILFNTTLIFFLSLWRGQGGLNRFDLTCLLIAIFGIVGWKTSGNPQLATISVVIADFMGVVPTYKKTIANPNTEGALAWGMVTIAAGLSFITTIGSSFAIWLYPAYNMLASGIETFLILQFRRKS